MFGFGATRTRVLQFGPNKGQSVEVRDFSLHVDCDWRVRGLEGIVVGWLDMFYRSGEASNADDDDWDRHAKGATSRRDERLEAWLAHGPYEVQHAHADAVGGFTLELARNYALDVFPTSSLDYEHWRLLSPDGPHFVVRGSGLSH